MSNMGKQSCIKKIGGEKKRENKNVGKNGARTLESGKLFRELGQGFVIAHKHDKNCNGLQNVNEIEKLPDPVDGLARVGAGPGYNFKHPGNSSEHEELAKKADSGKEKIKSYTKKIFVEVECGI